MSDERNDELEQLDDSGSGAPGGVVPGEHSAAGEQGAPGEHDPAGGADTGAGSAGTEDDPLRSQTAGGQDSA